MVTVGETCVDEDIFNHVAGPLSTNFDSVLNSSERFLQRTDGSLIPVLKTATGIEFNGCECIMESFIDLSEQKKYAVEKAELEKQLRQAQKMEALGTLAGGIAHDFNNILSAVIGYSELGCDEIEDNSDPFKNYFSAILEAGNRAKGLVGQILTFSRMKENLLMPIRIDPIVREALRLLQASLPADIQLKVQIDSREFVMADPTQIHQIVMNLCTNAYHAMEETGGTLSVSLKSMECKDAMTLPQDLPSGKYIQLTISDTGVGISRKILDRIFDPYFLTKNKNKGTGLGLAVVHGIVKSHRGGIIVNSEIGKGTRFTIFLPQVEADMKKGKLENRSPARGRERILFVDDEEVLIEIGTKILTKLGYQVKCVTNGSEALSLFRKAPFEIDLVITDLNMPGLTGDRLAGELLKLRQDIPVILCTGFSDRTDKIRAKSIGIREYLEKPLSSSILAKTIREILDRNE